MGTIKILDRTTVDPITLIGEMSGICYGSDTNDKEKNYKRGLDCIRSNHGRALEFPQIYIVIDGYSAKVCRELYTHIISVSRLQASTRYIDYSSFDYVVPPTIKMNEEAAAIYKEEIDNISNTMVKLEAMGIPKEDFSGLLPLNYSTKMILMVGMRELINICNQRLCSRAYHEMRELMRDIINELSNYGEEWKVLAEEEKIFVPKCEAQGSCPEKKSCGRMPKKGEVNA